MPSTSVAAQILTAIGETRAAGGVVIPEATAKYLLGQFGVSVPRGLTVEETSSVPSSLTPPLVLKAVSPTLVHKSDAGGVRVGLRHDELAEVADDMRRRLAELGHTTAGFLVEEMAPKGLEVVLGAVRTEGLGWAVMVGLGGIFVEVLEDVAFGLAPLTRGQIRAMLDELRGKALLGGVRGGAPVDIDSLVEVVYALAEPGGLLASLPDDVVEIDLNPIIVSAHGAVAVDARFVLREAGSADAAKEAAATGSAAGIELYCKGFDRLMEPQAVAVLGASGRGTTAGNLFIRNLKQFGFAGEIIPVHPTADLVEGLPAVASLGNLHRVVDYAYVALPAGSVAPVLAEGRDRVAFAQVISSGFGETHEGIELERELIATARAAGIRLIGPNCLGAHSTSGRLSFIPDAPAVPGSISVVSQSGGLSVDILRLGEARGVDFRGVISIGNGADVSAGELVEFFLGDPATSVVGLYLESLSSGREVLEVLSRCETSKPVVLLAGGRTADGARAATSHTGALSGNHRLWPALARQAGVVLVDTLDEFVDALHVFDVCDEAVQTTGSDVVLFGNGGGASVLAADTLDRVGMTTPKLPQTAIDELNSLGLPPGNGLENPIDAPAPTLAVDGGAVVEKILRTALAHSSPAAVISHFNVGIIVKNLGATHGDVPAAIIDAIVRARDAAEHKCHHILVLKTDGKADTDAQIKVYEARARAAGIPAFRDLESAARATQALLRRRRLEDVDQGDDNARVLLTSARKGNTNDN
ncbi:acetate--CoA ligase family protein [Rhodococcus tukisamuensis]|uniref:Acyl-CoA synthetase (NDP forming) n=2 Tax=Rhodococcus tukisamuensis TaxID=168276 RepID=A0A1G7EQ06_9NOCA|nr:acetate--CoA ligase family protein [Rhodococcus tukisamuensis]SDE65763.1 Acyl-CoA synthetase (NDP forming) [Rhodococcus tukisamuensis]